MRGLIIGINSIPLFLRTKLVGSCVTLICGLIPRVRFISLKNIETVFPGAPEEERLRIFKGSLRSLTRGLIDSARFDRLSSDWYERNVSIPFNEEYHAIRRRAGGTGILVVSGHIGSVELQAYAAPFAGREFCFVARSFKSEMLEAWWNSRRQKLGNQVIARKGAVRKMIEKLNSGKDVAVLIDQNIRRKHAVFVDWFGTPAATTFAPAVAVIETGAPIVISAIVFRGSDRYEILEKECCVVDILENSELSRDQKIVEITERISKSYQDTILQHPEEWFWIHRRWKTRPHGEAETFYE